MYFFYRQMNINPLIYEIYDRRDIRHLVTTKAMDKRLGEVNRLITKIPAIKRVSSNRSYKKLYLESRLIHWKRRLYNDRTVAMTIIRWQVELTDKNTWERNEEPVDRDRRKRDQTLQLLQLGLYLKTDDELREILAKIERDDA